MSYTHIQSLNVEVARPLSDAPSIAATAVIRDCRFGRYTEVGDHARLADSLLDDYAYLDRGCDIMSTDIGKFSNIASMVRINPGFHPMERPTLHHFTYRPVPSTAWRSRTMRAFLNGAAASACASAMTPGLATALSSCRA